MNALSGSSFLPTETGCVDNVELRSPRAGASHWCPTRFTNGQLNFPNTEVQMHAECYRNFTFLGHLLGRARDWYEIFGSRLVQNTATDFAQLKEALTKNFPVVRNRKDLEVQFCSSQQSRGQEPTNFIYDLLKVHKKLGLKMSEESLEDHIFV
ncbi:uncharacterized protein TNCV_587841 [Trichonephila clavipes]|nr:uncharacterized protein TNCV_587841 [Trichonephila clavipes]